MELELERWRGRATARRVAWGGVPDEVRLAEERYEGEGVFQFL